MQHFIKEFIFFLFSIFGIFKQKVLKIFEQDVRFPVQKVEICKQFFDSNNKMKKLLFLSLLCCLALQQAVLILSSSPANTIITSPVGLTISVDPFHNASHLNFIGNGAQWLWQSGGASWPDGLTLVFQTQFYAACNGTATLTITADNVFSALLNGVGAPMTGDDWTKKYTFNLSPLKCGKNTLVINVINHNPNTPAALIFSVVQDQSSCFKCQTPLSSFNRETCQCECNKGCSCSSINSLYVWQPYPICGCSCGIMAKCNQAQYFNQKNCSCQCNPVSCLDGYEQDKNTCQCKKRCPVQLIRYSCSRDQQFSVQACACVCRPRKCEAGYQQNLTTCQCVKKCPTFIKEPDCPLRQKWSQEACECVCVRKQVCQFPFIWSEDECSCIKQPICDIAPRCKNDQHWNSKCVCVPNRRNC